MRQLPKVLIVDDNVTNVAILRELLGEDYDLATALSGEEALAMLGSMRPDLILLDVMMPGIDGYEVCRRIRANPALRHVKIIMVSARAMPAERVEGYEAGADDYIAKPFDESELRAKVRIHLRLKSVEEIDQIKTDLLAMLGHATRTPLNGVLSPTEMLATNGEMDGDERAMLADMAHRNAQRLHRLIEQVLLLGSLRSNTSPRCLRPVRLDEIVRKGVENAEAYAASRGVRLRIEGPDDALTVRAAYPGFETAIRSVVESAVSRSGAGAAVAVRFGLEGSGVSIRVIDAGRPMDSSALPHIFDECRHSTSAADCDDNGLALPIARHIVEQHGGQIEVEASGAAGTIVCMRLPVCYDSTDARAAGSADTAQQPAACGR